MKFGQYILMAIVIAILGLIATCAHGAEKDYSRKWCNMRGWEPNHGIKKGSDIVARIDCLGPEYAIEFDFAKGAKYYEAIGQSIRYAILTGQKPGIVLIVDMTDPEDVRHLEYLKQVIHGLKYSMKGAYLDIKLWTMEK